MLYIYIIAGHLYTQTTLPLLYILYNLCLIYVTRHCIERNNLQRALLMLAHKTTMGIQTRRYGSCNTIRNIFIVPCLSV